MMNTVAVAAPFDDIDSAHYAAKKIVTKMRKYLCSIEMCDEIWNVYLLQNQWNWKQKVFESNEFLRDIGDRPFVFR